MAPGSSLAVVLILLPVLMCVADDCKNLNHQNEVNLHALTGTWFVLETVNHNRSLEHSSPAVIDLCPRLVVENYNDTSRNLNMNWEETSGQLMYYFRVEANPGKWLSAGRQEGSMARDPNYHQFYGQVNVLKAVGDHFVITFCPQEYPGNSRPKPPYSMVLSKDLDMSPVEIDSVNKMFKNRGLHVGLVKRMCPNGASSSLVSLVLLVVAAGFAAAQTFAL